MDPPFNPSCDISLLPVFWTVPQSPQLLKHHQILECFGLEGSFRGHVVQPRCSEKGHLQLDWIAQRSVQLDLECF